MPYRLSVRRQAISDALDAYLRGNVADLEPALGAREREVGRCHRAIPLYRNMTETIFMQISGALFAWDNATPAPADDIRPLDPMSVRFNFLLAAGSRYHPALTPLLPDRPPRAQDCHACGGAGFHAIASDFCYFCDALGWVVQGASG